MPNFQHAATADNPVLALLRTGQMVPRPQKTKIRGKRIRPLVARVARSRTPNRQRQAKYFTLFSGHESFGIRDAKIGIK
jgi:hypothetical protein